MCGGARWRQHDQRRGGCKEGKRSKENVQYCAAQPICGLWTFPSVFMIATKYIVAFQARRSHEMSVGNGHVVSVLNTSQLAAQFQTERKYGRHIAWPSYYSIIPYSAMLDQFTRQNKKIYFHGGHCGATRLGPHIWAWVPLASSASALCRSCPIALSHSLDITLLTVLSAIRTQKPLIMCILLVY